MKMEHKLVVDMSTTRAENANHLEVTNESILVTLRFFRVGRQRRDMIRNTGFVTGWQRIALFLLFFI